MAAIGQHVTRNGVGYIVTAHDAGMFILSPVEFGPLVQITAVELAALGGYTALPPTETEVIEQRMRAAQKDAEAYLRGGRPERPARAHKPLPGSPEDQFANGTDATDAESSTAREVAMQILKDPSRRADFEIGVFRPHPSVVRELEAILDAAR